MTSNIILMKLKQAICSLIQDPIALEAIQKLQIAKKDSILT